MSCEFVEKASISKKAMEMRSVIIMASPVNYRRFLWKTD
jgi:hypothetical protein